MSDEAYQPDGYTMLSRPWTAEQQAAHEANLRSIEPPTLAVLDGHADPIDDPAFRHGWVTSESIALAGLGFPEPEDRATATRSAFGDHECVQDLLRPGRIHVLAAEEGTGKSYFAKEVAIRVAVAGGDVAGTFPVLLTGTVLDLSEMHPDDDFEYERTVLDSLGVARSALAGRYFRLSLLTAAHGRPALMDEAWRAWAITWLRRHGARLLIVDTATGATLIDPWGGAIQRLYHDLRAMLAELPELCIVLVVHFRKPKGHGGRRVSDVLGEWGRWCDILVLLERDGDRTKLSTHKRVRRQRRILATRTGGLLVDPVEITDPRTAPKVAPEKVLAAVRAMPGMTYAELGTAIGVSKDTAARYVAGLGDRVRIEPGAAVSGPGAAVRVHPVTPGEAGIAASPHIAASDAAATARVSVGGQVAASPPHPIGVRRCVRRPSRIPGPTSGLPPRPSSPSWLGGGCHRRRTDRRHDPQGGAHGPHPDAAGGGRLTPAPTRLPSAPGGPPRDRHGERAAHGGSARHEVAMTSTLPDLVVEQVPIDELHPDPANPRHVGVAELEALTRSIRQWGFVQPVLARHEDSVVIGGHQRLVAARRLGMETVPVIWLDISTEQARLLNLALNRISGDWDEQLLAGSWPTSRRISTSTSP